MVLASLIGCGNTTIENNDPDARGARPDANGEEVVMNTTIDVTSQNNRLPLSGIHILYYDADDTLLSDVLTDTNGHATAPLPAGGTVVLMYAEEGLGEYAIVHRDVPSGSKLRFGNYLAPTVTLATTVTFPPRSGATSYSTNVACSTIVSRTDGSSTPITVNVVDCPADGAVDVYVDAFNGTTLLGTASLLGANLASSMTVAGPYLNPRPRELTFADIPATLNMVGFAVYTKSPGIAPVSWQGLAQSVVSGQIQENLNIRNIPDSKLLSRVTLSGGNKKQIITTMDDVASAVTISAEDLAPYAQSPIFDLETNSITWAESGAGTADLVYGDFNYVRNGIYKQWVVIGTHEGPRFKLPTLPSAFDSYNAREDDVITVSIQLIRAGTATEAARSDPYAFNRSAFQLAPGQRVVMSSVVE